MTTNEIIETLNSRIADLDADIRAANLSERAAFETQSLRARLARLYNARNRLPLHTGSDIHCTANNAVSA